MQSSNQALTFEQIPSYLVNLGTQLQTIQSLLQQSFAPTSNQAEKPVDIDEIADFAALDEQTIYRKLRAGEFPGHKAGRRYYFFKSEVSEWIRSGGKSGLRDFEREAESDFAKVNKRGR